MPLASVKQRSDMNKIILGAVKGMDATRLELWWFRWETNGDSRQGEGQRWREVMGSRSMSGENLHSRMD